MHCALFVVLSMNLTALLCCIIFKHHGIFSLSPRGPRGFRRLIFRADSQQGLKISRAEGQKACSSGKIRLDI